MKKTDEKKRSRWRELLLAFLITCVVFGIVIGMTIYWCMSYIFDGNVMWKWLWTNSYIWLGNGIAFLIVFLVVYHFIKKPKDPDPYHDDFNIK
jgi:heme/copper-type cytochrome/quinol oxidase subunit 2